MKKVSIKDIAREAGVSNATVSLVLNGKEKEGRVGHEVSGRVRRIARELNYQPNGLARSLQSGRTYTIGLIVADISNPFFGSLAYYVQEQVEKSGYTVMIMNTNESDLQLEKIINNLINRQVDGCIIVPTAHGESCISRLIDSGIPLVLIDRYYPSLQTSRVMVDNYQASYQATCLLIEKECKKIGLIIYRNSQSHMNERKDGYIDALQQSGLYNPGQVMQVDFSNLKQDMSEAVSSLLTLQIDGVLFATNSTSLLGLHALIDRGVKIPEEVQVVCFDRSEAFEFMSYPIPYIQQPVEAMGRKAADLLLEQISVEGNSIQTCKFPAMLIHRS